MSEDENEVNESLVNAYNAKVIDLVGLVQQEIELYNFIQEQKNFIGQFNVRQLDLQTLETIKNLLEAQTPYQKDKSIGEETIYEAVFKGDDAEALKKTVRRINTRIYREYGIKKEDDGGQ